MACLGFESVSGFTAHWVVVLATDIDIYIQSGLVAKSIAMTTLELRTYASHFRRGFDTHVGMSGLCMAVHDIAEQ